MLPPTIDEASPPVAPVMVSIDDRTSPMVSVLPAPTPIVTLPEAAVVLVVAAVENVMVLPLTVIVLLLAGVAANESDVAALSSLVAVVTGAGVARLLFTTEPVAWAFTKEDVPRRSSAVAPVIVAVMLDLVE